ncbi:Ubiquitin carboxyl-terminal hydrolase 2 [Apiospora kogelbergensis]|uniref:Ubiquitin carboxyl-terminal hydrolase n=1 Tax=Apiospora kogelbergensis TaxID=1337665 RepID=A0AAW0QDI5_9PEZI
MIDTTATMDEGAELVNRTKVEDVTGNERGSLDQSEPSHIENNDVMETESQNTAKDGMEEANPEPVTGQTGTNSEATNLAMKHNTKEETRISASLAAPHEAVNTASSHEEDPEDSGVVVTAAAENRSTTTFNPSENNQLDSPSSSKPKNINTCPGSDTIMLIDDEEPIKPIRRSTRQRRIVNRYEDTEFQPPSSSHSGTTLVSMSTRPKRKAAAMASKKMEPETLKANLSQLEHALCAMQPGERKEFAGWVEIESEPAFFNAMLHSFGAPSFQIRELWGLDPEALAFLPRPVHGLIFLYQYNEEDEDEDMAEKREECPEGLWFGNQTTANACATVAIMNILMNASDPGFGPELTEFKAATANLPPPQRGQCSTRMTSFVGYTTEWEKEQVKKAATNHYIAYVPVAGRVWELDGLEAKPLCHGTFSAPDVQHGGGGDNELIQPWLHIASSAIAARMEASADAQMNYNLLAVCDAPLISSDITNGGNEKQNPTPEEQEIIGIRNEAMAQMESRKLDYTPAIHAFLVKLAEMGLLRDALE